MISEIKAKRLLEHDVRFYLEWHTNKLKKEVIRKIRELIDFAFANRIHDRFLFVMGGIFRWLYKNFPNDDWFVDPKVSK